MKGNSIFQIKRLRLFNQRRNKIDLSIFFQLTLNPSQYGV